ncbi:MAG TPA: NAD-dependent epimerase/dehydratase family protein [Gemmatimonadales bacterium]|nr:NAD-dependent epimerase/dehydratase family protein [Gemmatimonadales bacterium]
MKVFLTGATGYIGSAVADALRGAGHEVSGLARSDASAARLTAMGVRPVPGDMTDPATIAAAAREADGVISAATTNDPGADTAAIGALLGALRGSEKPFVYTSGIWAYGDTGGRVVTEAGPATPAPLVAWRTPVERRVLESAGDGIRSVVIQPAVVYGRGGGIPAQFADSARRDGAARFVGTGENRWPMVHVDDLAELYVRALERAPAGTLLIAVAGPSVRVADMARAASEGAGAGGKVKAWPLAEARQTLGAFADALVLDQQASARRAEELLGWKPFRPGVLDELRHGSYAGTPG